MDLLFLLKKGISIYIHPLTISMELIVIGIVMVGFSRGQKKKERGKFGNWCRRTSGDLGMAAMIAGILFLFLASIKPVAGPLVYLLEKQYPPLVFDQLDENEINVIAPDYIVVLAGGERFDPEKPSTSQLSYAAQARINEGVSLARLFPKAILVFTGQPKEVRAMTEAALGQGITSERIVLESDSRDTDDHPGYLRPILGDARFLLVTSGTHMPRAMALFEDAGLEPIPASCDLWVWPRLGGEARYQPDSFIPRIEYLWMTHSALHEFMGMAWNRLSEVEQVKKLVSKEEKAEVSEELDELPTQPVLPIPSRPLDEERGDAPGKVIEKPAVKRDEKGEAPEPVSPVPLPPAPPASPEHRENRPIFL